MGLQCQNYSVYTLTCLPRRHASRYCNALPFKTENEENVKREKELIFSLINTSINISTFAIGKAEVDRIQIDSDKEYSQMV